MRGSRMSARAFGERACVGEAFSVTNPIPPPFSITPTQADLYSHAPSPCVDAFCVKFHQSIPDCCGSDMLVALQRCSVPRHERSRDRDRQPPTSYGNHGRQGIAGKLSIFLMRSSDRCRAPMRRGEPSARSAEPTLPECCNWPRASEVTRRNTNGRICFSWRRAE
jgi:hypothetical protein